ncbi:Phenolic glucoside malonyltransferase 2 [Linum perenne]
MTTRVIEICHVAPSPPPAADFTLPLTFFDTFCLKFLPVEQIFFYRFPSSATSPIDVIIPRLKRSLSLALRHFLPIAGKLTWPEEAEIPFVLYKQNDTVSLTIAESTVDSFDLLSGDGPHDASLSRAYVPKLDVSGSNAAVLALQVTVFCQGFCVGVTCHHGVFDGKSYAMFLKAWAHISKELAKAKGTDDYKVVKFGFSADCRSRLDPPLPSNYFGNCVMAFAAPTMKIEDVVDEGGIARVAREIIKCLIVGISGSHRLGIYDVDFGFGRPEKVEITSIDRSSAMSMAESGDGSGGVEVGVVMLMHEMEKFASLFRDGLEDIYEL